MRLGHWTLALGLLVVALFGLTGRTPVMACSCSLPARDRQVEFEGRVRSQTAQRGFGHRDVTFDVQRAVSGPVEASAAPLTVRITWGDDGNCGFRAPQTQVKGTYRIRSYIGQNEAGEPLLFANTCGGSFEVLAAPPDREGGPPVALAAVAAVGSAGALVAVVAVVVKRRHRR